MSALPALKTPGRRTQTPRAVKHPVSENLKSHTAAKASDFGIPDRNVQGYEGFYGPVTKARIATHNESLEPPSVWDQLKSRFQEAKKNFYMTPAGDAFTDLFPGQKSASAKDFHEFLCKEAGLDSAATGTTLRSPSEVAARNSHRYTPHERASSAVAAKKLLRDSRRADNATNVARHGTYTDQNGATHYYSPQQRGAASEQVGRGYTPQAEMTTMQIDPRYGGGVAMGSRTPMPSVRADKQLPTGSGVPMTAGEAYGTNHLGSGIYQDVDRSAGAGAQAYQMDARDARRAHTQEQIKNRIAGHYSGESYAPPASTPLSEPKTTWPDASPGQTTGPDQFNNVPPDPFDPFDADEFPVTPGSSTITPDLTGGSQPLRDLNHLWGGPGDVGAGSLRPPTMEFGPHSPQIPSSWFGGGGGALTPPGAFPGKSPYMSQPLASSGVDPRVMQLMQMLQGGGRMNPWASLYG